MKGLLRNIALSVVVVASVVRPGVAQSGNPTLQSITLYPQGTVYQQDGIVNQFAVLGNYSDGSTQDLTSQSTFSNDPNNPSALVVGPLTNNGPWGMYNNPAAVDLDNAAPLIVTATYSNGQTVFQSSSYIIREAGGADLGIPTFSVQQGGPVDVIDPATDVVTVSIPIRSKPGLIPFSYNLVGSSAIYDLQVSGNADIWQSTFQGFKGRSALDTHVTYQFGPYYKCNVQNFPQVYYNISIVDAMGTSHPLYDSSNNPLVVVGAGYKGTTCFTTATAHTQDNTGYTAAVDTSKAGLGTIYDRSGNAFWQGTDSSGNPQWNMQDPNKNLVKEAGTISGSVLTYTFTDTMNTTVLTVQNQHYYTAGSPTTYSYNDQNGISQTFTLNWQSYKQYTNFSSSTVCPSVLNPSGQTIWLPSSVTMPKINGVTGTYSFTYFPNQQGVSGQLQTLTLPTGGKTAYTYSTGAGGVNCTDKITVPTITRTVTDNVTGANGKWTYNTSGIAVGTTWINTDTVQRPDGNYEKYSFSNGFKYDYQTCTNSNCNDAPPAEHTYVCYNLQNGGVKCVPTSSTVPQYPITATDVYNSPDGLSASAVQTYFDSYGNAVETWSYDFGPVLVSDRRTPIGTWNTSKGTCDAVSTNIHDRLCYNNLYQADQQTLVTSVWHTYDGNGNNLSDHNWVGGSNLVTTYAYNPNGTVKQVQDPNLAVTYFTYGDCNGSLLTETQFPVNSLQSTQTWDCNGGVVKSGVEVSGGPFGFTYNDPLWRPDTSTDEANQQTQYTYGLKSIETTVSFGGSEVDKVTTLDGLGRPLLAQTKNSAGTYDTVETDYDGSGRIAKISAPFATTLGTFNLSAAGTSTTFDYAGRPNVTTDANQGTLTRSYYQATVKTTVGPTTPLVARQSQYDGLGRLKMACNISAQSGSVTCGQRGTAVNGFSASYTYREDGLLLTSVQGSSPSQTRTFTYDNLGRKLTESTPEAGARSFVWDGDGASGCGGAQAGDLGVVYDARTGDYTCYVYDNMHRLTQVAMRGSDAGDIYNFVWDTATVNSVAVGQGGQIAEAFTCVYGTNPCPNAHKTDEGFVYDSRGNVIRNLQASPNSGGWYSATSTYDALGNLSTAAFAPLPSLAVGLNSVGQTYTVGLSSGQNPVTGVSYGPLGIGSVTYGSGDVDTFSYKTSGFISNVKSTVGSNNYSSTPTWNTNGTLQKLVTDAGATVNYGYDDMGRISSASDGASIQQTYTYDQFGNLSTTGAPYSFLNGYTTGNHIITSGQCNGTGICYDADGNLLSDGDHAYTWDSLDRVSSIDGHTLTRDALGRVVEGDGWNGSSMFFYSPYGRIDMSGQALLLASISLPGGGKMLIQPTSTEYDRPDFQGNVALQSNTNQTLRGGIVEYSPFGQTYNGVTDYGFNDGSTEALASWTFDTPSRLLHGKQGRWISPDPAGIAAASLDNPQTLNAYAYASNDPLIFSDPSGLDPIWNFGGAPGVSGYYGGDFGCTLDGLDCSTSLHSGFGVLGRNALALCPQCNNPFAHVVVGANNDTYQSIYQYVPGSSSMMPNSDGTYTMAVTIGGWGWHMFQSSSWTPDEPFPSDPSGLGPDWSRDTAHKAPNDERYVDSKGNKVDWHKGRPGAKKGSWDAKDHWHWVPGGEKQDEHYRPGDTIKKYGPPVGVGAVVGAIIYTIIRTAPAWLPAFAF
jgi:RHS repeat-associated protein